MTQEQFIYWLQGFLEAHPLIENPDLKMIKEHLALVVNKVTPPYDFGKALPTPPYKGNPNIPPYQVIC